MSSPGVAHGCWGGGKGTGGGRQWWLHCGDAAAGLRTPAAGPVDPGCPGEPRLWQRAGSPAPTSGSRAGEQHRGHSPAHGWQPMDRAGDSSLAHGGSQPCAPAGGSHPAPGDVSAVEHPTGNAGWVGSSPEHQTSAVPVQRALAVSRAAAPSSGAAGQAMPMSRTLPGAGDGTRPLRDGWGCRRAVVTNCARTRWQRRQGPPAAPAAVPGSGWEDGAAGRQCELGQTERGGWATSPRVAVGAAAQDRDSKGTCLGLGAGAAAWTEPRGLPASQLPPTAIPLRGDPAGPHGSVRLRFEQLFFREADVQAGVVCGAEGQRAVRGAAQHHRVLGQGLAGHRVADTGQGGHLPAVSSPVLAQSALAGPGGGGLRAGGSAPCRSPWLGVQEGERAGSDAGAAGDAGAGQALLGSALGLHLHLQARGGLARPFA